MVLKGLSDETKISILAPLLLPLPSGWKGHMYHTGVDTWYGNEKLCKSKTTKVEVSKRNIFINGFKRAIRWNKNQPPSYIITPSSIAMNRAPLHWKALKNTARDSSKNAHGYLAFGGVPGPIPTLGLKILDVLKKDPAESANLDRKTP